MAEDGEAEFYWTRREKYTWFVTLLLGTSALYASRTTMPLVAPSTAIDLKWSKTEVGTVLSSFFWGYTLTQILGGYLSDRFGAESVLFVAGIGWGFITLWFNQIVYLFKEHDSAFQMIILSRVLWGACQGVHFPSMASMSSKNLNLRDRSFFFSATSSGSAIGTLLTGTVGSYVNDHYGWQYVFYVIGCIPLIWLALFKYKAMDMRRQRQISLLRVSPMSPVLSSTTSLLPASKDSQMKVPWVVYLKSKALWACVFCHFCQGNCFSILLSWLPTYFHDNFPGAQSWVFNVVPWLLMIPGIAAGGYFSNMLLRKGYSVGATRKIVESVCMGTEALCLILTGYTSHFTLAVFLTTCALFAKSFHSFGTSCNPIDIAPKHSGFVFGVVNSAGSIAGFIGVYLAGYILEVTGSWAVVFNVTAVINLLGIVVFILFGSGQPIL